MIKNIQKKFKLALLVILVLLFNVDCVSAKDEIEELEPTLELCKYEIKWRESNKEKYFIRYSFENKGMYLIHQWQSKYSGTKIRLVSRIIKKYNGAVSTSKDKFYMETTAFEQLINNGKCPQNAYYDNSGGSKEVCFDNNGKYCLNGGKKLNTGTDFNVTDSSKLTYNWEDQVSAYFNNTYSDVSPRIESCDEIEGFSSKMEEQIKKDFVTNYLKGYDVPKFMANSSSYTQGFNTIKEEINKQLEQFKTDKNCFPNKTDEEKEKIIDDAKEEINSSIEKVKKAIVSDTNVLPQIDWANIDKISCDDMPNTIDFLKDAFKLIKIIAPILVLVYGSLDYAKVVFGDKEDDLKKANTKFIKRLIAALVIFFLPYIIDFILQLAGFDIDSCGIN